jgi:hypothetical protein
MYSAMVSSRILSTSETGRRGEAMTARRRKQQHSHSDSSSQLLPLAREVDAAVLSWWPQYQESGTLDIEAVARMQMLRNALILTPPTNPTDAAIVLGAVFSVAAFLNHALANNQELDADCTALLANSATELMAGIKTVMEYLERTGAQSPEALGLFRGERALQ